MQLELACISLYSAYKWPEMRSDSAGCCAPVNYHFKFTAWARTGARALLFKYMHLLFGSENSVCRRMHQHGVCATGVSLKPTEPSLSRRHACARTSSSSLNYAASSPRKKAVVPLLSCKWANCFCCASGEICESEFHFGPFEVCISQEKFIKC
jgi:hypothetical protein